MSILKPIELLLKKVPLALLSFSRRAEHKGSISIGKDTECKILFIRPEKIGDIFIAFPIFNVLLKHFPNIKLSILGSLDCKPIIENDPRFYNIYYYQKNIWSDIRMLKKIRNEEYDCVVDLVGRDSVNSLLMTIFGVPQKPRVAVGKDRFRKYYDFNFDPRNNNTGHVITNSLKLLEAFGLSYEKPDCFAPPFINEETNQKAAGIFNDLKSNKEKSFLVGYNLSAGSPERMLSNDVAVKLLEKILGFNNKLRIILFAIGDDREKTKQLEKQFPDKIKLIPEGLNLIEASAVLKNLDIFITPDTSLVHIARSFEIPVVALYRRYLDNYKIWFPFGQSCGTVLSKNDNDISDLTADMIYEEFVKVIDYCKQEGKCQISQQ